MDLVISRIYALRYSYLHRHFDDLFGCLGFVGKDR
jgi:hypothetical protein